jgi:hypothetical protein
MTAINRAATGVDYDTWHGTMWNTLALIDPAAAVAAYRFNFTAGPPGGEYNPIQPHESYSTIYNFIHNLNELGRPIGHITADAPSYGVFRKEDGTINYVAFNPSTTAPLTVRFFDSGREVQVIRDIPPGKIVTLFANGARRGD